MSGFTKLSSSIVLSTVWREPHHVRIVWITLMALADANGYVGASIPGLADAARVTLAECEQALAAFLRPDPYSRTKAHDGRRIEVVDGGWVLLNHALYRAGRDPEARRLQNREAQARKRDRERLQMSLADVADADDKADCQPESAEAEAEAEADQNKPPTPSRARGRKPKSDSQPVQGAHELKLHYVAEFKRVKNAEPNFGSRWGRAMKSFGELALTHGIEVSKGIISRALSSPYGKRKSPWQLVEDANNWIGDEPAPRPNRNAVPPQRGADQAKVKTWGQDGAQKLLGGVE